MAVSERLHKREQRGFRRAARAQLRYVNDFEKGFSRRRCGRGFTYLLARRNTLTSARTRKRIKALAIPPSWEDVWICPSTDCHIQALGRDEAGRRQYVYHERWRAVSATVTFDRLNLMVTVLPRMRRRVSKDLARKSLNKARVLSVAVRLIDKAHLRVSNEAYTQAHGSHGVMTLREKHVGLDGITIALEFAAKCGRCREVDLYDGKVAKVIDRCEELDGQFLFCCRQNDGTCALIDLTGVNEYLANAAKSKITTKDFRTWAGSVTALDDLTATRLPDTVAGRKKRVTQAVAVAAETLGNTRTVAYNSYIHPSLLTAAQTGEGNWMIC